MQNFLYSGLENKTANEIIHASVAVGVAWQDCNAINYVVEDTLFRHLSEID